MKKPNSENLSKAKSLENDEMAKKQDQKEDERDDQREGQKEDQKEEESKKECSKEKSKNYLTSINGSQGQEDDLDIYPQKDSNFKLYDEIENFYDNQNYEEFKSYEKTEIKEEDKKESVKNNFQHEETQIISQELSLEKKKSDNNDVITISLYIQKIQKIINMKPYIFFNNKKKYKKNDFYKILKINGMGEYIEKIEFALKEERSESEGIVSDESDENLLDKNTPNTSLTEYLASLNINEVINENPTSDFFHEDLGLINSLVADMENYGIFTNTSSSSRTNDE